MRYLILLILCSLISFVNAETHLLMKLKDSNDNPKGEVLIKLRPDLAPNHVARIKELVKKGFYDGLTFHRVIPNFMAQGGDPLGNGTGGSGVNIDAEFSNAKHLRGTVSMARAQDPNSGDSQFFICFKPAPHLDGLYTVWGQVVSGMNYIDLIKKGRGSNGTVNKPDRISTILITNGERNYSSNNSEENTTSSKTDKLIPAVSGSGFIVSEMGHIVTNNHVIRGCETVKVHHKGKILETSVIEVDKVNDLAVLQADFSPSVIFPISDNSTELMQDVFVAGYPFGEEVSSSVKVTKGIVSSLSGIGNNYSNMQIDAALQPGNSGGPILDEKGNVLGVAVSKMDLSLTIKKFGVVPEGTNFGIKSSVLKNFLQANGIELKEPIKEKVSRSELSKKITGGTLFLSCLMTYAQIEKLKTQKVMFQSLQ